MNRSASQAPVRSQRWFLRSAALPIVLLSFASRAHSDEPLLHHAAPVFAVETLDQRPLKLHALRGKLVLLSFWATWCAPCVVELPHFVEWQRKYGPLGLQIIAVSMDDDVAPVRALDGRLKLNFPVAMGDAALGKRFDVFALPVIYLIDAQGHVQAVLRGESDLNQVEQQLKSLLPRH